MVRGPELDPAAVLRDAAFLDRLAAGDAVDDPGVALLAALRRSVDAAPAVTVVTLPVRSRRRRLASRSGAVLALMLVVPTGGMAAAAVSAHPGDLLYGVRSAVIGRTADDPHDARALLAKAEAMAWEARTAPPDALPHVRTRTLATLEQVRLRIPHLRPVDAKQVSDRLHAIKDRLDADAAVRPVGAHPAPSPVTHRPAGRHVVHGPAHHRPAPSPSAKR